MEKQRTQAHNGGGKKPQWSDTLQFQSSDQLMKVEVWDADIGNDDLIGTATVNLNKLYGNPYRT